MSLSLGIPPELVDAIADQVADRMAARQPAPVEGYMDSEQAAAYLAYQGSSPRKWASEFAARRGVPVYRDGTRLLFRRQDLDAALKRDEP